MAQKFTKIKSMSFPREIIAGHDAVGRLGDLCWRFDLHGRALIVSGKKSSRICGGRIVSILKKSRIQSDIAIFEGASRANVNACKIVAKRKKASFIVAVGGGSKIDIAKLAANELRLPFISIPTCASHDGIASPRASIRDSGMLFSLEASMPLAIIADTTILVKSPYRLLASGCADVIANLTAIRDWEIAVREHSEPFSRTAAMMAKISADTLIDNARAIKPGQEESVWLAIRQIISSGLSMGVAGSSRPTSGSEHLFSHALDRIAPGRALHGEQCGIGAIMMMSLQGGDWERIRDALKAIGAPTSARALGVSKDEILQALTVAHTVRPDRYTVLGTKGLGWGMAEKIAKATLVI